MIILILQNKILNMNLINYSKAFLYLILCFFKLVLFLLLRYFIGNSSISTINSSANFLGSKSQLFLLGSRYKIILKTTVHCVLAVNLVG